MIGVPYNTTLGHPAGREETEPSLEGYSTHAGKIRKLEKRIRLAVPVEISTLHGPSATERTSTENVCSLRVRVLTQRPRELDEHLMVRSLVGDLAARGGGPNGILPAAFRRALRRRNAVLGNWRAMQGDLGAGPVT